MEYANENKSVMQILREAKASGEFDDFRDYWGVNLDFDQIEQELLAYTDNHEEELTYMKHMHPRLYILVGEKLGWTKEEIKQFRDECF